jgi:hypothetical protein
VLTGFQGGVLEKWVFEELEFQGIKSFINENGFG